MGQDKKIAAIVLAAGYSKRMNAFKSTLPLGNATTIEYLVNNIKSINIDKVYVVTGYKRKILVEVIEKIGAEEIFNQNYNSGMFSSIKAGIKKLENSFDGCFLLPVDCPLIDSKTIDEMITCMEDELTVPTYMGKKGHPLYIPRKYFEEIVKSEDHRTLKDITDKYFERIKRIDVSREGVLMDMDTKEEYEKIKAFIESGCASDNLKELARGRTFYLIRHGQIKQHKDKIFLGETDIRLSKKGEKEAQKLAKKIKNVDTEVLYTSPLLRAKETAKIIAGNKKIIERKGFSEMALGEWDGKFIEDIKKQYPKEYKCRGENIWTFKIGNGSENFYDLQYRAIKELCNILKNDMTKEIIIVSHKGVIRAVENNLKGKRVSDQWETIENGEVRIIKC